MNFCKVLGITAIFGAVGSGALRAGAVSVPEETFVANGPQRFQGMFEAQLTRKAGEPLNILVLSGGAAHGAWGAGVLNGWKDTHKIPKWDVVTGISTGALLATFAFLGGEEDYETLHTSYTDVKTSDIIRAKWLGITPLAAIFAKSLYSSAPLKRRIKLQVTDDKIRQVADAAEKGRRLFVGTVNLYSGRLCIWDMTALAVKAKASNAAALFDKYREVLRASAAIPAYFPAVPIDNALHVDGGTREQLFFREGFLNALKETKKNYHRVSDARPGAKRPPAASATPEADQRFTVIPDDKLRRIAESPVCIYVIVNGRLTVEGTIASGNALSIGLRSISILTDAALVTDLFATQEQALGIPGGEFRYMAEPPDSPPLTDGQFDGKEMTPLYNLGYYYGHSGKWSTQVNFDDVDAARLK